MTIFLLAPLSSLLAIMLISFLLTYFLRSAGLTKAACAVYFVLCIWAFGSNEFTTTMPSNGAIPVGAIYLSPSALK